MPTTRRLRTRARRELIDPTRWAILTDTELPVDVNRFILLDRDDYQAMLPLWTEFRSRILAEWIKTKPGTRPAMWWRYDSPRFSSENLPEPLRRWSRTVLADRLIQPRWKLRGEGKPLHAERAYVPRYHYGIPAWLGDPDNPPVFETQRVYLKRHGLLLPAERGRFAEPYPHPLHIEPATRWK